MFTVRLNVDPRTYFDSITILFIMKKFNNFSSANRESTTILEVGVVGE